MMNNIITPKINGGVYTSPECKIITVMCRGGLLKVSGELPSMTERTEDW